MGRVRREILMLSCAVFFCLLIPSTALAQQRIGGVYNLYDMDRPERGIVTKMEIILQTDANEFLVRGLADQGAQWEGEGEIDEDRGYYDWKFTDGRSGRTTFEVRPNGTIQGHVLGSGIDWRYLARPAN